MLELTKKMSEEREKSFQLLRYRNNSKSVQQNLQSHEDIKRNLTQLWEGYLGQAETAVQKEICRSVLLQIEQDTGWRDYGK